MFVKDEYKATHRRIQLEKEERERIQSKSNNIKDKVSYLHKSYTCATLPKTNQNSKSVVTSPRILDSNEEAIIDYYSGKINLLTKTLNRIEEEKALLL